MDIAVLIPAYNPGRPLLGLVAELLQRDFRKVVVVDDGSHPSCRHIFDRLAAMNHCHVVQHAVNLGKGRALKTGFNYCRVHFPELAGIVTADADGQHLPEDVGKVAEEFLRHPRSLVIGARRFARGTPFRSVLGNVTTRYAFKLLVGGNLTDTQSGLRCIPMDIVPQLIPLAGERFEYEMNMLILAHKQRVAMREVEIATVYLDNNRSSHFNPLIDSMKIYFLLLRFSFSSLVAASIDFLVFSALYMIERNILTSLIAARLVSGAVNFLINRNLVFHDRERPIFPLVKYLLLFVALAGLSYLSIRTMADFGMNVIAAKVVVETVLFFGSFTIQRDFVFVDPVPEREG